MFLSHGFWTDWASAVYLQASFAMTGHSQRAELDLSANSTEKHYFTVADSNIKCPPLHLTLHIQIIRKNQFYFRTVWVYRWHRNNNFDVLSLSSLPPLSSLHSSSPQSFSFPYYFPPPYTFLLLFFCLLLFLSILFLLSSSISSSTSFFLSYFLVSSFFFFFLSSPFLFLVSVLFLLLFFIYQPSLPLTSFPYSPSPFSSSSSLVYDTDAGYTCWLQWQSGMQLLSRKYLRICDVKLMHVYFSVQCLGMSINQMDAKLQ
jgi:hypothetical protein